MTSRDFCYWLQGFFEIQGPLEGISEGQAEIIKNHLAMVFHHEIDPSFPANEQDSLNNIHNGIGGSVSGFKTGDFSFDKNIKFRC